MNSEISQLVCWYVSHCDGSWEHSHGFIISTLDNPAIRISINLHDTVLENAEFHEIKQNYDSETEWYFCRKDDNGYFEGVGSPEQLEIIISIFLKWAATIEQRPRVNQ